MRMTLYDVKIIFDDESKSVYSCTVSAPSESAARVAAIQAGLMGRYIRMDEKIASVEITEHGA